MAVQAGKDQGRGEVLRRATAVYKGRVQGVGFRFTVVQLVENRALVGEVKNMHDGTVRLVVEGKEKEIHALFNDIVSSRLGRYISDSTTSWSEATGEYKTFSVGY